MDIVQDNGMGMPHGDIPDLLGRVLSGTKYGVQQTRGKFGLGAKMALIWSKMSTGLPIEVKSARKGQSFISHYRLDIDIHRCACRALIVVHVRLLGGRGKMCSVLQIPIASSVALIVVRTLPNGAGISVSEHACASMRIARMHRDAISQMTAA